MSADISDREAGPEFEERDFTLVDLPANVPDDPFSHDGYKAGWGACGGPDGWAISRTHNNMCHDRYHLPPCVNALIRQREKHAREEALRNVRNALEIR